MLVLLNRNSQIHVSVSMNCSILKLFVFAQFVVSALCVPLVPHTCHMLHPSSLISSRSHTNSVRSILTPLSHPQVTDLQGVLPVHSVYIPFNQVSYVRCVFWGTGAVCLSVAPLPPRPTTLRSANSSYPRTRESQYRY